MSEIDKQLAITQNHYRQLDFLRLFRLARSLGLVKRKRKMPVDYDNPTNTKVNSNARSACRRLLRVIIKHLFDDCEVTSNWNHYFITLPQEHRVVLSYFMRNIGYLGRSDNREVRDAVASFREIREHIDGFVYPALPAQIKVRLSTSRRSARQNIDMPVKPAENFYRCAVACMNYKTIWTTHIDAIIKAAKSELTKNSVAAAKKNVVARTIRPPTETNPLETTITERPPIVPNWHLSEQVIREAVELNENNMERVRNAQGIFDQALSEFLHQGESE